MSFTTPTTVSSVDIENMLNLAEQYQAEISAIVVNFQKHEKIVIDTATETEFL